MKARATTTRQNDTCRALLRKGWMIVRADKHNIYLARPDLEAQRLGIRLAALTGPRLYVTKAGKIHRG